MPTARDIRLKAPSHTHTHTCPRDDITRTSKYGYTICNMPRTEGMVTLKNINYINKGTLTDDSSCSIHENNLPQYSGMPTIVYKSPNDN